MAERQAEDDEEVRRLIPDDSHLHRWQRDWFISLSHSASATKTFFRIPPSRAIELGNQIQI